MITVMQDGMELFSQALQLLSAITYMRYKTIVEEST